MAARSNLLGKSQGAHQLCPGRCDAESLDRRDRFPAQKCSDLFHDRPSELP